MRAMHDAPNVVYDSPVVPCPDDDTVAALAEGRLDEAARQAVTLHLDACARCRELVAEAIRGLVPDDGPHGAPLPEGATVGRYVVRGCVGAGAMGIVYLAHDPELGRNVALKLLRPSPSPTSSAGARALLREAQAMAKLTHPNVITVYDVGTAGEEVFVAMELVDGGTLRDWLGQPRPWREVVAVMKRAGEGLEAAHAAGLVHRDFKPDNVLIGRDGRVRVTDFGLARETEPGPAPPSSAGARIDSPVAVSGTGTLAGTPAYMAPEIVAGQPADVRADVFSFCVTFYEALYRERPFTGATLPAIAAEAEAGRVRPAPPGARVPAWLRRVVLRGLLGRRERRPPSIRAILEAVDAVAARTRRGALGAWIAGLLLASTAGAALWLSRDRAPASAVAAATRSPPPTAITDEPLPPSSNPEALRAYARGLQAMRDGTWGAAEFERSVALDPSLSAAHLRYAMLQFWQLPTEGRAHLARAVAGRSALNEHDAAILRAAQAWMQSDPADDAAFVRLIDEAATHYPGDAELAYYAGLARTMTGDHPAAIAQLRRATALDPGFAAAYQLAADEQAYAGDLEGALATIDACVARAPEATRCLMERSFLDESEGDCARLEQDARRMQTHDPDSDMSYGMMAMAAYAQGKPLEVVRELLRQWEAHATPGLRRRYELTDRYELAALSGDFDEARRYAGELGDATEDSPDRRHHVAAALMAAAASLEAGDAPRAARSAQEFLARQEAFAPEPRSDDFAVLRDGTPGLWLAEREGGLLAPADYEAQRDAWVNGWGARLSPAYRPYAWLHGYARFAVSKRDALAALDALPRFGTIPRFTPLTFGDAFVGATYFLADHPVEALPFLQRASRACLALTHPFDHTRATFFLGAALEATGDRDGACRAYGVVIGRWGTAKRSVTAAAARKRARTLRCL